MMSFAANVRPLSSATSLHRSVAYNKITKYIETDHDTREHMFYKSSEPTAAGEPDKRRRRGSSRAHVPLEALSHANSNKVARMACVMDVGECRGVFPHKKK